LFSSTASDFGGGLSDFFSSFFASGGPVKKSDAGRFVDRNLPALDTPDAVDPTISADGAVDPNPQTPAATGSVQDGTAKSTSSSSAKTSNVLDKIMTDGVGGAGGGPGTGGLGGLSLGMATSVLGHSPIGMAINFGLALANAIGQQGISVSAIGDGPSGAIGIGQGEGIGAALGGTGTGGSNGIGSGTGLGGADGIGIGGAAGAGSGIGGDGYDTGGKVSGPGTSTSDSVAAHLSDGEYVIDAKTVAALGPEFFQAIQAKFNPAALKAQKSQGRI
jgi:hypothetical protein